MFYLTLEWVLVASRSDRNLEQDWAELRAWVQQHQHLFRLAGIAQEAGVSPEIARALLLRDTSSSRLRRDWDRLDAFLRVFMAAPFGYVPSWQPRWRYPE